VLSIQLPSSGARVRGTQPAVCSVSTNFRPG
jgi:hypothetical protein